MTTPNEPTTPGATDGTTDATGSSTTSTTTATPQAELTVDQLKAEVDRLRRENASSRTTAKANAAKEAEQAVWAKIATAMGQTQETDPKVLTEQLTAAQQATRFLKVERAVDKAARKAGADEALLTAVLAHGGKLSALDPESADFASQVETIVKAEVAANPRLLANATAPLPAVGQGATAQFNNGNASTGQLTQADLDDMTARGDTAGIAKALKDGKLRTLLGGG